MNYVEVAISKLHGGSRFYTYQTEVLPKIGQIVSVPFGDKSSFGIVFSQSKTKPSYSTKSIKEITDYILPDHSIELLRWMIEYYPEDVGLITQLFMPQNVGTKPRHSIPEITTGHGKPLPPPTQDQKDALKIILKRDLSRALLHGGTGTGKTYVFIHKALQVLKQNKSVLILTPEIGLTPQLINNLAEHLPFPIISTHSQLTNAQRRRIWEYALNNQQPSVFVGPRSALFLPYTNLGLIIVDEAHDASYKQTNSPRYNSLNVAGQIALLCGIPLIHSTATPNVDDYHKALAHNFEIIRMKQVAAGNEKRQQFVVDITDRNNFAKDPYISNQLIDAIKSALSGRQQTMLFLNRRGSARLMQCSSCGWQALCPKCGVPLIFHHDSFNLRCHTCSFKRSTISSCPMCSSTELTFSGIGTKTLVEHTHKLFPTARIKRFDADSIESESLYKQFQNISNGDFDILIGTQLLSKGLDLPQLSVVGIINADSGLNLPDFRAEEITFQQLYQAGGRTGRGRIPSKLFIQTRLPKHPVISSVINRSWEDFFAYELSKRQQYKYPPFCFLAAFSVRKRTLKSAQNNINNIYALLSKHRGIILLGPSPAYKDKVNDEYCWQIIAKARNRRTLLNAAKSISDQCIIDLDPTSLL